MIPNERITGPAIVDVFSDCADFLGKAMEAMMKLTIDGHERETTLLLSRYPYNGTIGVVATVMQYDPEFEMGGAQNPSRLALTSSRALGTWEIYVIPIGVDCC